jgi:hypothetical protein
MIHGYAATWHELAAVIDLAARPGEGGPHGYMHGWIKVADEINDHGRQIIANGKGDKHKLVGYRMGRAAEELRAGNRKAALSHLHAARLDSLGQSRRAGRPGMGRVDAPGLGEVHSLIDGHMRKVGSLPS